MSNKSKLPKSINRNAYALDAMPRKAGMVPMKDRRTPRGGSKNTHGEYINQNILHCDGDDCTRNEYGLCECACEICLEALV